MNTSLLLRRHWWKILLVFLLIALVVYEVRVGNLTFDRDSVMAYGKGLPATAFIIAFLLLPLVGAPISIFLILTGIRFGFGWGMAVTAGCILFHHLVAYQLSHGLFRQKLRGYIEKKGHKVPSTKENALWFTTVFAVVPGAPYAFKLYLLSLTDVPFRIYFFVGAPIYIAVSMVSVGAAAAVMHFNMWWIYAVIAAVSVGIIIKRYLKWKRGVKAEESAKTVAVP